MSNAFLQLHVVYFRSILTRSDSLQYLSLHRDCPYCDLLLCLLLIFPIYFTAFMTFLYSCASCFDTFPPVRCYFPIRDLYNVYPTPQAELESDSYLSVGMGMTIHQMVNNRRRPQRIPIVPGGPRTVWTIALATKAPRKEDMIPKNRISRDGTRRGEARHGSPNSSTSYRSQL